MRFGDDKRAAEDRHLARTSHVRDVSNSPFWPFVLATTSLGQEGLDFYAYCHVVDETAAIGGVRPGQAAVRILGVVNRSAN